MRDSNSHASSGAWQELTDASSGTAYFYNASTGQTQWERPAAMHMPAVIQSATQAVQHLPQTISKPNANLYAQFR